MFFLFYCSGLNFQDLMVRLGAIDSPPKTPTILGFECAGEVEAVGEGVEDFQVKFFRLFLLQVKFVNII
jgi:NADPH:quinone reductase-like Zn-dependent oxidoreductase